MQSTTCSYCTWIVCYWELGELVGVKYMKAMLFWQTYTHIKLEGNGSFLSIEGGKRCLSKWVCF